MITEAISHYRIIQKLGAGGMGEVFLAEDTKLGRKVAIKFLNDKALGNEQARRRLIREAKAAATLDHPNICTIHEVNDEGENPFIVMQYIEGETLAHRIKNRPLEIIEAVDIAVQVTEALAEAHSHRIIHRDIKPQNVIVTARGQVKVLDFGLAKILAEKEAVETEADTLSQLSETGQVMGTVGYMSPEQLRGERVDSRTDLFSLGVLLYNCATGRSAFTGSSTMEICLKVVQTEPARPSDINPGVPLELESIIIRAMAKDVEARYSSADDMLQDLLRLRATLHEGSQVRTRSISHPPASLYPKVNTTLSSHLRRKPLRAALLVVPVLLLLIALLVLPFLRGGRHQPSAEARRWYEIGTNDIREGAYYKATQALERAIALDNRYALAHARLAEAYMEMDYSEKAKAEMLTARSLLADRAELSEPDALYLDAIAATVNLRFAEAVGHYQKIADQAAESEKASTYMDLGRSYEKTENIDRAIELYQEAARLDPQSAGPFLRMAVLLGRKQELDKAGEAFETAEKNFQAAGLIEGVTEVLYQRGTMLNKINRVKDAREQLEKAVENARVTNIIYQQIRAQLQLSAVYIEEDTERAGRIATEAIELAQASNIRSLAVNGLIDLGYTFAFRGEYDEAGRHFKQALSFAQHDKAQKSEARAHLALGILSVQQTYYDQGIELLERARSFYEPAGYRKETSIALTMLGRAQREKGNYDEAVRILEQQLQLSKQLGDSALVADAHVSLGLTLGNEQERYTEALPHIEESYKINQSSGSPMNAGYDQMNMAGMLWRLGRYDEARRLLGDALAIATRPGTGYRALQAWVHLFHAQMALSERRFAEAQTKARRALELAGTEYRNITVQAKYCIALAQANSGARQPAIQLCEEALAVAREIKTPGLISSGLLTLAEVRLLAGDGGGALATALQAEEMFARSGRQDSQWRALLVAARAGNLAGNRPETAGYVSRADSLLASLQQRWGAEAFGGYVRRPDIQTCRDQLARLLRTSK